MDASLALMPVHRPEIEVLEPEAAPQGTVLRHDGGAAQEFARMVAWQVMQEMKPAELSDSEKFHFWSVAFAEWLSEDPRKGGPRPANTREAYAAAWASFRDFCPKMPWNVEGLDVKGWVEDLRGREVASNVQKGLERNGRRRAGQQGLSDATINQYLAAISAFFSFAEQYEVKNGAGQTVQLFDGLNPAKSRMVKRPKANAFGKSIFLDVEQLRGILQAIRSFGERNRAKSLRDYALFLCYVSTGARNSEVRTWRWGDLEQRGSVVYYRWSNKGKSGRDELPADAWEAVRAYLQATGRLANISADSYIFTPLCDNVCRLGRMGPEDWNRNRPLSPQEVNRCLRQYARLAGLEPERIHVHVLRHSAYMLYREAGLSLEERSRLLHHSSLAITSIYDHAVAGQRNVGWAKASTLLGL